MNKNIWTEEQDSLLLKLRSRNLPYKEIIEIIPKSQDACRNRFYELKQREEIWQDKETLAVLDIEATDLEANNGFMLSWSLRYLDGTEKHDLITKKEIFSGKFDKRIVNSLVEELKKVDVVITYYGCGYDLPYVRTRAIFWGIEFFAPNVLKIIDLYFAVKFKLKLTRNSLDVVTHFLGIEGKTKLDIGTWGKARYGDIDSLKEVLDHNIADTEITLQLYNKLKGLVKFTRKSI